MIDLTILSINSRDFQDSEFDFEDKLIEMTKSSRRDLNIIAVFLVFKKIQLKNKFQLNSFIKRNLRSAKLLEGYSNNQIWNAMDYLKRKADFKWTLETVGKYIDEIDHLNEDDRSLGEIALELIKKHIDN